jgi:hypothetical protein
VTCEVCGGARASDGWLVAGRAFEGKARLTLCSACQSALGVAQEATPRSLRQRFIRWLRAAADWLDPPAPPIAPVATPPARQPPQLQAPAPSQIRDVAKLLCPKPHMNTVLKDVSVADPARPLDLWV